MYNFVMNRQSGVALVTTGNPRSTQVLHAVGATSPSQIVVYSNRDFGNGVGYFIGNYGVSTDEIPTSYRPQRGNYMGLSSGIKSAAFNTGSPLAPHLTQPQATHTDQTIGQAINSVLDFLKWIAWIFSPHNFLRAVEFVTGLILVLLGLRASSRALRGRPAPVLTSLPRPRLPGSSRRQAERQGRRQAQRGEARTQERIKIRERSS